MKFVALALALLLAVGSQAASLPADAPSQLEHARAAMDVYMTQVKDSANRALDQLDDTEYKELKITLSQRLEDMYNQIKTLQGAVAPMTDSVVGTLAEATADFRSSVMTDIDTLKAELEDSRTQLKTAIEKHLEDYRTQMEPIFKEYYDKHTTDMAALKDQLQPKLNALQEKIATNVEETKSILVPMVETVRKKLYIRLENLKEMAAPYVQEYKDQLKEFYVQAQSVNTDEITAIRDRLRPVVDSIKANLQSMVQIIATSIMKN